MRPGSPEGAQQDRPGTGITDGGQGEPKPEPGPAGLWAAFWPLLASGCSFLAALAALSHNGRSAFLLAGLAVVSSSMGMALNRWQAEKKRDEGSAFAEVPLATLNLLGLALLAAGFALLVMVTYASWRGLDLWGDLLLWKEGARNMGWTLALVFALGAVATYLLRRRPQWTGRRHGWIAAAVVTLVLLFGPTLTVEVTQGGSLDQRELYIKHSLPAMMAGGDEAILHAQTLGSRERALRTIVCVRQRLKSVLMFGHRSGWMELPDGEYDEDAAEFDRLVARCEAETRQALESGEAIESELLKGQFAGFFARIQASTPNGTGRAMAADIAQMPEPLGSNLTALLPVDNRWNYRAFDVALAIGDKAAALATMPGAADILPHQRQAMFSLGLADAIDRVPGETTETLAAKRDESYRSDVELALRLGSADMIKSAMASMISTSFRGASYGDFKGGFTVFDYFMANRSCDVAYAKFLKSRQQQPSALHILHLLSLIGHAQYPNVTDQSIFGHADVSLGLPKETQLRQCVELAAFYGEAVRDFNEEHPELGDSRALVYRARTAYDAVYALANDAVTQWWVRDSEKTYHNGIARDTTVVGDPAILIRAATEVLKAQPPSYEQYCAWANTVHAWQSLVIEKQPEMGAPMRALPNLWRQAKVVYQSPSASCHLSGIYVMTNEYTHPTDAVKYLNAALARAGIPCQGRYDRAGGQDSFVCAVRTIPWPGKAATAPADPTGE